MKKGHKLPLIRTPPAVDSRESCAVECCCNAGASCELCLWHRQVNETNAGLNSHRGSER